MEPKHLYTIRWTQPYATYKLRPYLRSLQEQMEQLIEYSLEDGVWPEAQAVIEHIKGL